MMTHPMLHCNQVPNASGKFFGSGIPFIRGATLAPHPWLLCNAGILQRCHATRHLRNHHCRRSMHMPAHYLSLRMAGNVEYILQCRLPASLALFLVSTRCSTEFARTCPALCLCLGQRSVGHWVIESHERGQRRAWRLPVPRKGHQKLP